MRLASGSRVGPYEISSLLGAGGMGEVYRARDHKLQRDVALKVLPDGLVDEGDRAARFEREARTLAALNHPNIATIHGFEDGDGARALVMELVEGPTLADRIRQSPLPSVEGIAVAVQIVDALEAAHEQGIIHRDLKPANIKVRPDGTVKVLDFGLAKVFATVDEAQQPKVANSPTITEAMMSRVGLIVGTAAYMSPEQARGQAVDKRTDIWAFGCVLYEMLAGRPAFAGETTTDILSAVVQQDPDWSRLPPTLPRSVVSLLHRCLQKNARERLRDIGDARADLRTGSAAHDDPSGLPTEPAGQKRRAPSITIGALGFLAGAAATAAIFLLWFGESSNTPPATPARVVVALPPDVTLAFGRGSSVAISPDGRRLVYAARPRNGEPLLYLRALDRYESVAIPGTAGAAHPFFSPDGRWVAFVADSQLKKVSLDGGAPVVVADVRTPRGQAWTTDEGILVTPANNVGLSRIPAAGGAMQAFTALASGEMSHRWPLQLQDGSAVLFTVWNDTGWEPARIAAQRAGSTEHTVVVTGGGYPRYVRDPATNRGYLVYARSEGLIGAGFDEAALKLTGLPVPLVDGVATNLSGGAHFDLAADGTLAYLPGTGGEADRDLVWVTPDGKQTLARRIQRMGRFYSLAPDGNRVLRQNTIGQRDVWIEDLERGATTRLTNGADHFSGVWSADGLWAAYGRGAPAASVYRMRIDRPGTEERLTMGPRSQVPSDFSPDGTHLSYTEIDPVTSSDLWVLALPKPGSPDGSAVASARPFVKTNFSEGYGHFSPDGRWIVYQSNESGRFEVYIRSFPNGERTLPVSVDGGISPVWPSSGGDIYYRGINGTLMAAAVTLSPEFRLSKPRALFNATRYENVFDVSPDGKRLLMMPVIDTEGSATQVHVVLNFLTELRQRLR